jgi:DNA-binding MarR family transcriptional regulator
MEPTTFSALKAMEKRGYILRKRYEGDRKKVFIFLTPKGRALKAKLVPLALEVNEIAIRGVSAANVAIARQMLLRMIQNLADDEANSLKDKPRKHVKARSARQSSR